MYCKPLEGRLCPLLVHKEKDSTVITGVNTYLNHFNYLILKDNCIFNLISTIDVIQNKYLFLET